MCYKTGEALSGTKMWGQDERVRVGNKKNEWVGINNSD